MAPRIIQINVNWVWYTNTILREKQPDVSAKYPGSARTSLTYFLLYLIVFLHGRETHHQKRVSELEFIDDMSVYRFALVMKGFDYTQTITCHFKSPGRPRRGLPFPPVLPMFHLGWFHQKLYSMLREIDLSCSWPPPPRFLYHQVSLVWRRH